MIQGLTPEIIANLPEEYLTLLTTYLDSPFYNFQPRPDSPEEYDEQESFVTDKFQGVAVALGGNGSGKSAAGAYKAARFVQETPPPRPLTPFLVASQDLDMVGQLWVEKYRQYINPDLIAHISWRNKARQFPREVILKPDAKGNSWVLDFRSYLEGREQFQAISAGGFHLDELCPWDVVIEIMARCRDYEYPGSKIITLTPIDPAPELEELFNNQARDDVKHYWSFYRLNTKLNTTLPQSWFDMFYGSLPEDMIATRMIGDFAHYSGVIFKEFNSNVHIIQPRKIPSSAVHYRGIDFGWRQSACVWAARDGDTWYVYHELQTPETFTEDFAKAIQSVPWIQGSKQYSSTFSDWEDPQAMARLRNLGINCVPAKKAVQLGIETIRRKLIGKDGEPQLFIFATCEQLIRQMKGYKWKVASKSKVNPAEQPDEPQKHDDHIVDATRYVIYSTESVITKPWAGVTHMKPQRTFFGR
jgi:hypothetical protein